ncbi:MAG: T9SS type A sorting domain-containing protein [Ignavibacteriales bacterium]|nr:T9SS type A sorting domain-containing protein [Ignavibacteriales bacterium]
MIFTGPFTLTQNDTQWTMLALVPGLGNSNLNSITAMREKVEILRSLPYDSLAFGSTNYFITDVEENYNSIPEKFFLSQNYPNPFNPSTKISWQSPVSSHQTLKIYDVLGNEVATLVNEYRNAGSYEIDFNASKLSSGIYFYRLSAGSFVQTKKMILIK